jgi:5-methylcytosine-specific restriction endonuclease McrA
LIFGKNTALDHLVPRSKGGTDTIANLQWVDESANIMKWDYMEEEFIANVVAVCKHLLETGRITAADLGMAEDFEVEELYE